MNNSNNTPNTNEQGTTRRRFDIQNAVVAFLGGCIGVPLAIIVICTLVFDARLDGESNLGFWALMSVTSFIGAVIAGRYPRMQNSTAVAIGAIAVVVSTIVFFAIFVVWSIATGNFVT